MSGFVNKHGFKLVVLVILIGMVVVFMYQSTLQQRNIDERLSIIKKAPEFQLTNIQSQTVKMSELDGKVRLVYFFFSSCPDVCLPTTFFLSKIQDELQKQGLFGEDAMILSITVDPDRDTPEVLQAYADRFQADPSGWMFLRGNENETKELAEQYGVMAVKQKDGNFVHSNSILIVDQQGNVRNYYNASDETLEPSYIVKDVVTLSKQK
jgi:protein SCO1/2